MATIDNGPEARREAWVMPTPDVQRTPEEQGFLDFMAGNRDTEAAQLWISAEQARLDRARSWDKIPEPGTDRFAHLGDATISLTEHRV